MEQRSNLHTQSLSHAMRAAAGGGYGDGHSNSHGGGHGASHDNHDSHGGSHDASRDGGAHRHQSSFNTQQPNRPIDSAPSHHSSPVTTINSQHNRSITNTLVPIVVEQSGAGERSYDIYSRLLKDRIIFLGPIVTEREVDIVIAQLLYLASQDHERDISLYISYSQVSVMAAMAIYDTMQYIQPDIQTICVGGAAEMSTVLLAAGTPGKRYSLPSARIMIHQPMGRVQGQSLDIDIKTKEIVTIKKTVISCLAKHTKQSEKRISQDIERVTYMSATEAQAYGVIDEVFTPPAVGAR